MPLPQVEPAWAQLPKILISQTLQARKLLGQKPLFRRFYRRGRGPVDWVMQSQTRAASVFYPGHGGTRTFAGGFMEMLGVKEVYQAHGNVHFQDTGGDTLPYFAQAEAAAKNALGLISARLATIGCLGSPLSF